MKNRFSLKEIAHQSGLSLATVDRVLHQRAGVRAATQARVTAAIGELERQFASSALTGHRIAIDVIIEAPKRFTAPVQAAFEAELPGMRPASLTARFHLAERMPGDALSKLLATIAKRGSHGVILKAQDRPETHALLKTLNQKKIPVWTYVTDQPTALRQAYVGMDNLAVGRNAAWLLGQIIQPRRGTILVSLSAAEFSGEDLRADGFRETLAKRFPQLKTHVVTQGHGVHLATKATVAEALKQDPDINAVYSSGGGNRAILEAFADARRPCLAFGAHDLDAANRALLTAGKLSFVFHHDLRQDARTIAQLVLAHHRMLPRDFEVQPSQVSISTPLDFAK